jgi:hypothetical protein
MSFNSENANLPELESMMARMGDLKYHFEEINPEEIDLLIQYVSSNFIFFDESQTAA